MENKGECVDDVYVLMCVCVGGMSLYRCVIQLETCVCEVREQKERTCVYYYW
jgi:hypothetical protein